jgi:sugar lactone lactonase YvrE
VVSTSERRISAQFGHPNTHKEGIKPMAKTRVIQSFRPPEESLEGLAWVQGRIWTTGTKAERIFRMEEKTVGEFAAIAEVPSPVKNPGGLTWDGKAFFIADRFDKVIFRLDPETSLVAPTLDLSEVEYGDAPEVFQAKASQVTDLTWGHGHLWLACQAGYSSSVFRIDLEKGQVVQHFWARGPKPEGLAFDMKAEFLWTVDDSNQEFSQFTPDGEWTETSAPSPVLIPNGLSMDEQDAFWTSDRETGLVYQIAWEE